MLFHDFAFSSILQLVLSIPIAPRGAVISIASTATDNTVFPHGSPRDSGHIPGAILIPNESIGTEQPEKLPEFNQVILIYCRSGNRSKQASQKLADMGYTHIYEFGGIMDWNGEIVTSE